MTDSSRAELERQLAATSREMDDVRLRMDTIREAVATEVDSGWGSPWKSPDTVDAMLRARLTGRSEYQELRRRQRELEERQEFLRSQLDGLGGRS